jgi:hypothetical protein
MALVLRECTNEHAETTGSQELACLDRCRRIPRITGWYQRQHSGSREENDPCLLHGDHQVLYSSIVFFSFPRKIILPLQVTGFAHMK